MKNLRYSLTLLLLVLGCAAFGHHATAAEKVFIHGGAAARSEALTQALTKQGFEPTAIDEKDLNQLGSQSSKLLILTNEQPVSAQSRLAVSRFLQSGGHAIVVGARNFRGAPIPTRSVGLGDFARDESYQLVTPERDGNSNGEKPKIEKATAPNGNAAVRLSTSKRDMINIMAQFPATAARSAQRNVLTFQAKGDAYMDLLALEATDSEGKKYFAFAPISQQWATYAVSLADFIPEGWNDAQKPYPLLDPAKLETIALGTNRATLWQEKPMDFSIAQVALAENTSGEYAPTPALNRLQVPFKEIGIATPNWIFDPFYNSQILRSTKIQSARETRNKASSSFQAHTWRLPSPYSDFPGTKMGTDNRKEYDTRPAQSLRRIALWENEDATEVAAELRLFTGGPYAGSCVALYGFEPNLLQQQKALSTSLAETAAYIVRRPKIAQVEINTTTQTGDAEVAPLLKITLQNPLDKIVNGQLQVQVAGGKVRGTTNFALAPRKLTTRTIELSQVPADFDFRNFDWQVNLSSNSGADEWRDSVNVERLLLRAFAHMESAQKIFPDGRISNHYFSDAYGARAMLAYVNFLKKHPEHQKRNRDLWRTLSPEQIRATALRFGDMIVRRQNANGSVPMGYGEQSNSFNVADGGQISLGLAAMAYEVNDEKRRAEYLQAARKIIDFGETFYITEAIFQKLQREDPELVKKDKAVVGYYGLGVYGGGRRVESGPIWVLADLLATQALLSYAYPEGNYQQILERNVRLYLDRARPEEGWYQAEAMIWAYLSLPDGEVRRRLAATFRQSFLKTLYTGKEYDMYDAGSRGTLRALPLVYGRRILGDSPSQRAALLKYVWTAGSETSGGSVRRLAEAYPNPHHGASISAMKFAQFSSIWAMELLSPGSTLLQTKEFLRVPANQLNATAQNATAGKAATVKATKVTVAFPKAGDSISNGLTLR